MKLSNYWIYSLLVITVLTTSSFVASKNEPESIQSIIGDTTYFEPNTNSGWTIYSYYFHEDTPDSVDFELILKHAPDIKYWTNEQWIGTISGKYIPQKEQILKYYLLANNRWNLRIAKDGKCYLNVVTGTAPVGSTVVIPIKVKYKKS